MGNDDIDVWLGLDVGKQSHHACALDRHGKRIVDKPLGQDEAQIRELLACLGGHGNVLLVVDQPNTIGSLPLAVARDMGVAVGYLPGSAMRKAAQLLPGDAKTDARDAYVIAFTALHMPDTLRDAGSDDETMARLKVLAGFDDDLAFECNRQINRLRSLLLQIHPAFERALKGDRITRDTTLALLEHYGGPTGMRRSGRTRVGKWAKSAGLRRCDGIIDDLFDAIGQQNVTVAGTQAVEEIVPVLASRIRQLREQREQLAAKVETLLEDHPLLTVLTSMPGIAVRTASQILLAISGDITRFNSAAHLAAYAGIAPVTRRSGTSIRGEHPARGGNKRLKNALWQTSFIAAFHDPESHAYHQRKRNEGKRHNAAIICLARRRCNVIYSMLKNATPYQPMHLTA
ncbi:IS110 family transposase [Bifidobacterium pseudolongum]|uniref:Transposase n=1 Tax=Bifidobacterium pseudolongum subsp. globosum TaxID=1690 RepID=A0A4Q5A4U5_9BIFI|nr:IS110 family transposase [Bifidobacterium pseudolongum]MCH4842729.1 IS110 family transposase [Bifidobacterium pseudolongum]RYQ15732.1 transposase [Bifidobacterium pseudolongum subsp. globosum]